MKVYKGMGSILDGLFSHKSSSNNTQIKESLKQSNPKGYWVVTEGGKYYFHSKKDWEEFLAMNPQYSDKDLQKGKKGGRFVELKPGTKKKEYSEEEEAAMKVVADKLANERCSVAEKSEPAITEALVNSVKDAGGDLNYVLKDKGTLEFRLKTRDSLSRKLVSEVKDTGRTLEEAEKRMYDVNRYTSVCTLDDMADNIENTFKSLQSKGFRVARIKNTIGNEDASYRGVNCVLEAPDKTLFELQFHTAESLRIKEDNHKMYEVARKDETPKDEKDRLDALMKKNAKSVKTPRDINRIQSFNTLKESHKRFRRIHKKIQESRTVIHA